MSDTNHADQTKLLFWIDNNQLLKLDEKLKEKGYKSRAEWIREKIREEVNPSK